MMINKRLIGTVPDSKKYIAGSVLLQWCSLFANIGLMTEIAVFLTAVFNKSVDTGKIPIFAAPAAGFILLRFICTSAASRMSFLSCKTVKKTLREKIYKKMLRLGSGYSEHVRTSEAVQVAVEGVEQLETYFGAYLPQFFYAMLAPATLFAYLCFTNAFCAVVLLVCVPLIPVAIAAVQTWAKKLLGKYWGQYTALGDTFLENLQGLTTLKIYRADEFKNNEMNEQAEKFRKITMKVLTMQLNSVTIMDFIAYGGAALGIITAALQYASGGVTLTGCLIIILLSADFFIPMRRLGSFFHVAMNGMAASDKIFAILDLPEPKKNTAQCPDGDIICKNLCFSYEPGAEILREVDMAFSKGSFTSIVGESGCGKSTLAAVLTGKNKGYSGFAAIGGAEISQICEESLAEYVTYIGTRSYLFKGTVRDNLLMGCPSAGEEEMWNALDRVNLSEFFKSEKGLDTQLTEQGGNLSGGQRQRLALARALLHDSRVYIFDEAASNIDVESENDIMREIYSLAGTKTVILISHRLANAAGSDNIYVMENGKIAESGSHETLLQKHGVYEKLWNAQQRLERFETDGETA